MAGKFSAQALSSDTFADLEDLFARPGGSIVRGCWCMFFRRSGKTDAWRDQNREALRDLASSPVSPGLIGYLDGSPVGWISLGPREDYLKLRRSPIMKPVDDTEVWSIVCSFVAKAHRGEGLQGRLLAAAIDYARDEGVRTLEAYPVDKPERSHDDFMFFGSRSLYERAGFKEVVRRSPTRVVMRRTLRPRAERSEPGGRRRL
jgi:GNAT superfamily N-acetyltransferase